jgi:drug/metabolite transporter (DMT)-like permease
VSIWSAIALSALATSCYQVGLVLQKIAADRLPRLGWKLEQRNAFRAFLRSPMWLSGMGIQAFGWIFFLKAVASAPVSVVQPVLGFGLALLAVFSVVVLGERLRAVEWAGIATMLAGLVLLGVSASGEPHSTAMALGLLAVVSLVSLSLLASALALGRAGRVVPLPVVLGFGAGVLIGLAALYTKGLFLSLHDGLPALGWCVFLPLMASANVAGLWVQQAGFQQGRALIVGATNAVTNKLVTILGGMIALGELLPREPALATARIAGFVAILAGTLVLARFGGEEVVADFSGEPRVPSA